MRKVMLAAAATAALGLAGGAAVEEERHVAGPRQDRGRPAICWARVAAAREAARAEGEGGEDATLAEGMSTSGATAAALRLCYPQ